MSHKFKVGDRVRFIHAHVLVGSVKAIETVSDSSDSVSYPVYEVVWDSMNKKSMFYLEHRLEMYPSKPILTYAGDLSKYDSPYIRSVRR
jgi:hypothetical protein